MSWLARHANSFCCSVVFIHPLLFLIWSAWTTIEVFQRTASSQLLPERYLFSNSTRKRPVLLSTKRDLWSVATRRWYRISLNQNPTKPFVQNFYLDRNSLGVWKPHYYLPCLKEIKLQWGKKIMGTGRQSGREKASHTVAHIGRGM